MKKPHLISILLLTILIALFALASTASAAPVAQTPDPTCDHPTPQFGAWGWSLNDQNGQWGWHYISLLNTISFNVPTNANIDRVEYNMKNTGWTLYIAYPGDSAFNVNWAWTYCAVIPPTPTPLPTSTPLPTATATATSLPHPAITSITPPEAQPGQPIDIWGTDFTQPGMDLSATYLTICNPNIGGCYPMTLAYVNANGGLWENTHIRVVLPTVLTHGIVYDVLVTVSGLNSAPPTPYLVGSLPTPTATPTQTPVPHPHIDSITPLGALPGQLIEIHGSNFIRANVPVSDMMVSMCNPLTGGCALITATELMNDGGEWEQDYIRVRIPSVFSQGVSYDIMVNVGGLNSAPPIPYVTGTLPPTATATPLPPTPTATPAPAPFIKAVLPAHVTPGGKVVIFGSGFNAGNGVFVRICDANGVRFGTKLCVLISPNASDKRGSWNQNSIAITLPGNLLPNHQYEILVQVNGVTSNAYPYLTGRRGPLPPVKILPPVLLPFKTN